LHALEKLLSLSKQEIPIQFVAFLVDGILIKKNEGNFIARVEKVLEEICLRFSQEHRYWQIFAAFYKELKNEEKELDCRLKEMRAVEVKSFGDESEKFKALAKISKEICERYVEQNTSKSLYLAQILIGKLLKKYKQQFENENGNYFGSHSHDMWNHFVCNKSLL